MSVCESRGAKKLLEYWKPDMKSSVSGENKMLFWFLTTYLVQRFNPSYRLIL